MASNAEIKAASYYGPRASATPTNGDPGLNTIRFATSEVAASPEMNSDTMQDGRPVYPYQGKYVNIKNEHASLGLDVAFSVAAQTLVYGQTSASFAVGDARAGWNLSPGETISAIVPNDAKFFNHILESAGTGKVAIRCSEGNVGNK